MLHADYDVGNVTSWHNDVVLVTCNEGFLLDGGENMAVVRCNETQEWDPIITKCTGNIYRLLLLKVG